MVKVIKPFSKTHVKPWGKVTVQFNAAKEEPATIQIYEDIGEDPWNGAGFTAKDFSDALADIPRNKPLDLRINSAGGSVWDGLAIKTLLDEWPARKTASIDGMAASVASWLPMSVNEIRAPKHAQMFIHDAWGFCMGNADDMIANAKQLDKTSAQIADIYARKTGMSQAECRDLMKANTLMTAEEAHEKGFIDRLTEEEPVANFSESQIRNMTSKLAILNSLSAPNKQGGDKQNQKDNIMNKERMIALLNKWGVTIPKDAADEQLLTLVEAGPTASAPAKNGKNGKALKNAIKFKEGDSGEHADDCDCAECGATNSAHNATNRIEALLNKLEQVEKREKAASRTMVENRVKQCVEAGRIPAGQMTEWIDDACNAADPEKILNRLEALEPRPPGIEPLNIKVGETTDVAQLNKAVEGYLSPSRYIVKNRLAASPSDRVAIGENAKAISAMLNAIKTYDSKGILSGPLRAMYDAWAATPQNGGVQSPRNANTMSSDLLRQVILSEFMRAFRRQFATLSYFCHTYQNVPLEGNDYVKVPYYPLDTGASTEFTYSSGYVITPAAQTLAKSVLVGGVGNGVATAGSGRKYKGLQFSAYEIRRQPWLNIAQLTVMAAEQLAIDVRADIIGTQVSKANFGSAIWQGVAGGFDHTIVAQYLQNAAIKAFWPSTGRNVVLAPDYYTALAADPGITPWLNIGSTDILRKGVIGGLYGFDNIDYDALVPVASFIRGGDGTLTTGNDLNLCGYMCYPSAVLVATAPIMPPPGVLKKLVSYEQVTDDQTGLSITYQYFGLELNNVDNEIIECTYGSGLGELAALKRLVSSGT